MGQREKVGYKKDAETGEPLNTRDLQIARKRLKSAMAPGSNQIVNEILSLTIDI